MVSRGTLVGIGIVVVLVIAVSVSSGVLGSKVAKSNDMIEQLNDQVDALIVENGRLRSQLEELQRTCQSVNVTDSSSSSNASTIVGAIIGGVALAGGAYYFYRKRSGERRSE